MTDPSGREVVDSMKVVIRRVQTFYAAQMEVHGYGRKTFRLESDTRDEPIVHLGGWKSSRESLLQHIWWCYD